MFTGLIEATGAVSDVTRTASGLRLAIRTALAPALTPGESVAVNGVCLTVTGIDGDVWTADVGPETARVTTVGSFRIDDLVNLERSMRADGRFGGHLVQGHVDGTGTVEQVRPDGTSHWFTVSFAAELAPFLVAKGAVALDGISLTVARLDAATFDVMVVPFTWTHTNLPTLDVGDHVNLECDVVGKYVARAVALFGPAAGVPGVGSR